MEVSFQSPLLKTTQHDLFFLPVPSHPYPSMSLHFHGGSTSRNWNSSYKDSTTGHGNVSRLSSNSEGSCDISPEPWQRNHNQGAANSQASDGQQPRDCSNMECNGPSNPRNGKHKLNQAVTEFLGLLQPSKRFKSDLKCIFLGFFYIYCHIFFHSPTLGVCKLHSRAHSILQFLGPFIHVQSDAIKDYGIW